MRGRGLLLALMLTLGTGCSVQFAYNNLDRLARWSVNDYLDMDEVQRAYFDAAVAEVWVWHRHNHLPRYAETLDGLTETFADGTDEAEMAALVDRVVVWAREIEQRALPVASELLASLSDEQVGRLARRLEESNREIAEPEAGLSLQRARRAWQREFADRFGEFSGRLTREQKAHLAIQADRYLPERTLWADYRRRWQRELLALLEQRENPGRFAQEFERLARSREAYYGDELAAVFDNNERLTLEVSVWFVNHLTERQRARFFDRLGELAEDFRELAARGDGAGGTGARRPCLVSC